jgi:hypothetical protein
MNKSIAFAVLAVAAASLPASLVACSGHDTAPASENVGQGALQVALTAVGPDGATYAITAEQFEIQGGSFSTWIYFDPTKATESFSLPSGSYTGQLLSASGAAFDAGATFPLTKKNTDGTTTTVPATLVDPDSFPFTIENGQTTALTLHFQVPGLGDVTFSAGTLTVGASVSQVNGGGSGASFDFPDGSVAYQQLAFGDAGDGGAAAFLAAEAGTPAPLTVTAQLTGAWTQYTDSLCATAKVTATTTSANAGVAALLTEATGSGSWASVCFFDAKYHYGVSVSTDRSGAPVTPQLQGQIAGTPQFQVQVYGQTASAIYTGSKFSPELLAKPTLLNGASAAPVDLGRHRRERREHVHRVARGDAPDPPVIWSGGAPAR